MNSLSVSALVITTQLQDTHLFYYLPPALRRKVDLLPWRSDSLPLILVTFTNRDNSRGSNSNELAPSTKSMLS